ncbi:MAG: type 1 glutamine amidotransferase, partial [Gaiellaceae bacterium]
LAGTLYERVLHRLEPQAVVDVLHPADVDVALPSGRALADYDGVVWTGSSLTIHHGDDPRVRRQIELARAVFESGVPSFGSCWAAQLAVVAQGGRCAANPKGREFGIARRIALTSEGRSHAMYRGKPPVFDAFTSHADEVTVVPPTGHLLASNEFSRVQAVAIEARGWFWAVQYHPEYDLHEVARLSVFRMDELIRQGTFRDRDDAERFVEQLETLHRSPTRDDIRNALGIDAALLDEEQRTLEARNWIDSLVKPHVRG